MFIPCGYMIRMKSYYVLEKTEYGVQFILSLGAVHEVVAGNGWSYIFICTEWTKTYLTSLVKYCGNTQSPTNKKALYVPSNPDHMAVQDGQDLAQGHRRLMLRAIFINSLQLVWSKIPNTNSNQTIQKRVKDIHGNSICVYLPNWGGRLGTMVANVEHTWAAYNASS